MNKSTFETNYDKLNELLKSEGGIVGFMKNENNYVIKIHVSGLMMLTIEKYEDTQIAMDHHYIQNDDVVWDPMMLISVNTEHGFANAVSYEDTFGYQTTEFERDGKQYVKPKLKKKLNSFLRTWLGNLKKQGFYKKVK